MENEEREDLMHRFMEALEAYGLEVGTRLDQVESDCDHYLFFADVFEQLHQSKVDFCTHYFSLSDADKEDFLKKMLLLFKDQEIVDNIMQEIINLYYLNDSGLLAYEELNSQREVAYENLETLSTKIEKYLNEHNYDQLMADYERLSLQIDGIVLLGSTLEEGQFPVQDIDFLRNVIDHLQLSNDDKKQILFEILHYNIDIYHKHVESMRENQPIDSSMEIEELRENPLISEECFARINELLSQRDIMERIVAIINDEFTTVINIKMPTVEEEEQIADSIAMAREALVDSIQQDQSLSPEAALDAFFVQYDETLRRKREVVIQLTETIPTCSLSLEEQQNVFQMAYAFLDDQQLALRDLSKNDQEKVRQYMLGLFQNVENRRMMYESGMFESKNVLLREAAYEIAIYKDLLEAVPEEDLETRGKVCIKLKEILDCLGISKKKPNPAEVRGVGHLFFLMEDDSTTSLESDIEGVTAFDSELRNQLLSIEDRSKRKPNVVQPSNDGFKMLKKYGVRYSNGSKTRIYFIPVGKRDAIIVGSSFVSKKDNFKGQDNRLKRLQEQLDSLKMRLSSPDSYDEELQRATLIRDRIMSQLNHKELEEMFSDTDHSDDTKGTKK